MFPANFSYHRATSFADASALITRLGPDAKLIAGGQTLIPLLKLRLVKPTDLVDIGRIAAGREISAGDAGVRIGALATHAAIGASGMLASYPILSDCALGIADAQIRSLGTIGGSIAEADPSSCWPTLLAALGARAEIIGPAGARSAAVAALLEDAYTIALAPGELITAVTIDAAALAGHGAFVAFKRAAPSYPTASCALQIKLDGERCASVRLGLGCVGLTPLVVGEADTLTRGKTITDALVREVAAAAAARSEPIADNRGSEAYKRSLVAGLVRRAFDVVLKRRAGAAQPETHFYYG